MTPIGSFPGQVAAAKHTVSKSGRGGAVSLPSDTLTAAQWNARNGEVRSLRLRPGLTWADFIRLSENMQREYLIAMVGHGAHQVELAKMLQVSQTTICLRMKALGVASPPKNYYKRDLIRWLEWCEECEKEDKTKMAEIEKYIGKDPKTGEEKTYTIAASGIMGDEVLVLQNGTMKYTGSPKDILADLELRLPQANRISVFVRFEVES